MSNTASSRADPVVVFPLGRWCPPQETSQPHPPQLMYQNATIQVYGTWIKTYYILCSKAYIATLTMCYNPPLVRDKLLGAPTFVKLVYSSCPSRKIGSNLINRWLFVSLTHYGLVMPYDIKKTWSALVQLMACCLTAPNHYMNQCWPISSEVLRYLPQSNAKDTYT